MPVAFHRVDWCGMATDTRFVTPGADDGSEHLPVPVQDWASEVLTGLAAEQLSQHCAIFVFDAARNGLVLVGQLWGAGDDIGQVLPGEWLLPLNGSVCGRVFRTSRPALIADTQLDPDYRPYPGGRSRSELAVPIVAAGATVGVINCESPFPGTFGIADLERLTARAAAAGASFEVAGLEAFFR